MPSIPASIRKTHGFIDGGYNAEARELDFVIRHGVDATMGTATDDIQLGLLPAGSKVISANIEQLVAGTGTGTLQLRVGTTAVTGTLASTAAAGTQSGATAAALPRVVPASGEELNLLGATAVRNDGVTRVTITYIEGQRTPARPIMAIRDTSTGTA